MDARELTTLAMQKTGRTSQERLGELLGVSHVAVGKWLRGETCPTFEQAAELADLAGLPPVQTAAEVRLNAPDGEKHGRLLRRMAKIAAAVALTLLFGRLNVQTAHAEPSISAPITLPTLSIMSNCTRWARRLRIAAMTFIARLLQGMQHGPTPAAA